MKDKIVPMEALSVESSSLMDDVGIVVHYNNGVYRLIRREHERFYRDLLCNGQVDELLAHGLVSTKVAPIRVEGYELVLQHRRISRVSYCMEWSSEMLRDAALMICDLSVSLYNQGLVLKDAHPWNVLYDGPRPVFVDWGSIMRLERNRAWPYREFHSWFVLPLLLMAGGMPHFARMHMLDVGRPLQSRDVYRLLVNRVHWQDLFASMVDHRRHTRQSSKINPAFFESMARSIRAIPLTSERTEWSAYIGMDNRFRHDEPTSWPLKIRNVAALVDKLQPKSVTDIGCNRGWLSELVARKGINVVAFDLDDASINTLFAHTQVTQLPILPLVSDIVNPAPAHGTIHSYASAPTRLRSEMVLALAITHHLVFKRNLSFEAIVAQLALFTEKWLIVEFVPPEDVHVRPWMSEATSWYRLDNFVLALRKHFTDLVILESTPAPRILILCRKHQESVGARC